MKHRKLVIILAATLLVVLLFIILKPEANKPESTEDKVDTTVVDRPSQKADSIVIDDTVVWKSVNSYYGNTIMYDNHVITGQKACEEIVGKFDGVHVDTVFIKEKRNPNAKEYNDMVKYYLCSRSGKLPPVELYGCYTMKPIMYAEGDLDGNGTDEIGYLHAWVNSQWRYYRILSFRKGKWRYMFSEDEEFLSTCQAFRHSGKEIAQPSGVVGKVKITYGPDRYRVDHKAKDTIVAPHFTRIKVME